MNPLRRGGTQRIATSRLQNILELERTELENIPFPRRLLTRARQWRALTDEVSVLRLVTKGIRLPFVEAIAPRRGPAPTIPTHLVSVYEAHLSSLLERGIIEETPEWAIRVASLFFDVPKRSGGVRFVHDLRYVNSYLDIPTFRMETLAMIRSSIPRDAWFTSIDLKDAYWHVPVPTWLRRFLAFHVLGRSFQWAAMPMGLASSARYFTILLRPVLALLRQCGVMVFAYLDDILVVAASEAEANVGCQLTLQLLESLGFLVNYEKSELRPTQRIRHLGFTLDGHNNRIYLPQDRRQDLQKQARKTLRLADSGTLTCRLLASLIGKAQAALEAMPNARYHIHALHRSMRWNLRRGSATGDNYSVPALLSPAARQAVSWWASPAVTRVNGAPLRAPRPRVTLTTDASETGWGATVEVHSADPSTRIRAAQTTFGHWSTEEAANSSNWREAMALQLGFFALRLHELPRHTVIRIHSDNTTAISYLRRGGGRFCHLAQALEPVTRCALRRRFHLLPRHIAGENNQIADRESRRMPERHDWTVDLSMARRIFWLAQPTLDAFASRLNHITERYCSRLPDPHAMAVDGLSVPWSCERVYAAPPIPLIPQVINKAVDERASVTLLTPNWPNQAWFGRLMAAVTVAPILVPARAIRLGPSQRSVLKSGRPTDFLLWQLGEPTPQWKIECALSSSGTHSRGLSTRGAHRWQRSRRSSGRLE